MQLPKAWTSFLDSNEHGASCLGPHSGLTMQRDRFAAALRTLTDPESTQVVLVTRPNAAALREANEALERRVLERTRALETAQSELMRRERIAQLIAHLVGQLAGAIAHQIRNPLGSIKNAAYLLKLSSGPSPDRDVTQSLAVIHDEVRRANQIITDLLDYARGSTPESNANYRAAFGRDFAGHSPVEVEKLILQAGFAAPVACYQASLIRGWGATRR